jgi:hypothetical protein
LPFVDQTSASSCGVERDAVEFAKRVDLIPVRSNVTVPQGDVVRAAWLPAITAAAWIKAPPLRQEFGQTGDGVRDAPSLVRRQAVMPKRPLLQIVPAVDRSKANAIGVDDMKTVLAGSFHPPRRWKTASLVA